MFLADTHAEHTGGGTSDQVKASRIAYSLHSRIRYGFKHFGPAMAPLLAAGTLVIEPFPRLARAIARGSVSEARDTCVGFARLWRRLSPAEAAARQAAPRRARRTSSSPASARHRVRHHSAACHSSAPTVGAGTCARPSPASAARIARLAS